MRRTERFIRISRLGIALATTLGACFLCTAQEIGFIDLTQVVARTEHRLPAPLNGEVGSRRAGAHEFHECTGPTKDAGAVRTTLVWLDRGEYSLGDKPRFEVLIENVGAVPVKIPFSPHLADLQPEDAGQKFGYYEMDVGLWIGGTRWDANNGGLVALYGADTRAGSILKMHPGESVRIIGNGRIVLPGLDFRPDTRDEVSHANARISIYDVETLSTATATALISHGVCPDQSQGPNVDMRLHYPK
jgi:hypothetical protein